ncbi:MAG: O-antigen ligase family protein [Candidatus Gottesmanbacteria bacterium]|nr:O-antigen ligase family protein [Candidatus Gottesmanbacteria bacterium]
MNVSLWCDRVIRWGFYLLFGLVPILLTPWNYELFEFNKMMAVYALTVVITGAWLVKSVHQRELRIAKTPLDIPILLFLFSQLLSSLFSIDPHVSWFGYYSRFNGGMLSIISYVLLYYALISNIGEVFREKYLVFRNKISDKSSDGPLPLNTLTYILKISLATGVVVALYGVAERLGIDRHLWVQDVQNRVFSTLGQPNWLAAYLVALTPLAMALGLQFLTRSGIPLRGTIFNFQFPNKNYFLNILLVIGHWSLVILFFAVLLFTRSRSGLFAFAVADIVFWGLFFIGLLRRSKSNQSQALKPGYLSFILVHVSFFLIVFFSGTSIASVDRWLTLDGWKSRLPQSTTYNLPPTTTEASASAFTAPLLETGGTESGTIRKYVWQGAINAWRSSTKAYLIGTGTETFAFAFYQYRPQGHNMTSEWDFLYNKAHNEYLNYLATTGIFGLGSYLLLLSSFVFWFIKSQIPSTKSQTNPLNFVWNLEFDAWCLRAALFAGWLSILVTNFFGFSVVIVQVFLFLFPAIIMSLTIKNQETRNKNTFYHVSFLSSSKQTNALSLIPVYLVLLVLFGLLALLSAGWYADTLYASGYRMSRAGQYDVAVAKLSQALTYNPLEPLFADELGMAYAGLATTAIEEKDATRAAQFVRMSLAESDRAITTSPKNVNFWKTRTKIYYTFSSFDPAFNDASIAALEQAQRLSPNDPKITYNLSILYGRKGDNTKAIDLLKSTITLKPNYRDGYYALWVFYTEIRKSDLARTVLKDYLAKVDAGDKEFLSKVNE